MFQEFHFFFYLSFLCRPFTNHRTTAERGEPFFSSSLPLSPASETLRHQPGDYYREVTSAHRQQLDSSWQSLGSKRKSLSYTPFIQLSYYKNNFQSEKFSSDVFSNFRVQVFQGPDPGFRSSQVTISSYRTSWKRQLLSVIINVLLVGNLNSAAIEIHQVKSDIAPQIMKKIFELKEPTYNLR